MDYVHDESLLARVGTKLESLGKSIESRKQSQSGQAFVSM